MKDSNGIIMSTLIGVLCGSIAALFLNIWLSNDRKQEQKVEDNITIGNCYVIDFSDKNDPFDDPIEYEIVILDKKDGYIKYQDVTIDVESSMEIDVFNRIVTKKQCGCNDTE